MFALGVAITAQKEKKKRPQDVWTKERINERNQQTKRNVRRKKERKKERKKDERNYNESKKYPPYF